MFAHFFFRPFRLPLAPQSAPGPLSELFERIPSLNSRTNENSPLDLYSNRSYDENEDDHRAEDDNGDDDEEASADNKTTTITITMTPMTAARSYWPSEETARRRDTPGMALGFSNLVPGIQITLSCLSSRYNARTCLSDSLCPTLTTVIPSCLHTEYSLVSEGTSNALVASSRTKKIQKTSDGRTVFVCFLSLENA